MSNLHHQLSRPHLLALMTICLLLLTSGVASASDSETDRR